MRSVPRRKPDRCEETEQAIRDLKERAERLVANLRELRVLLIGEEK